MADNNSSNHTINNNHGLSQDAQGSDWWEMISPRPRREVLTGEIPQKYTVKKKSKCHGNIKLQHFKRKCRARGLNEDEINKLIHTKNQNSNNDKIKQFNKRKRNHSEKQDSIKNSIQSMSQLSISQEETSKKMKQTTTEETKSNVNQSNDLNQCEGNLYKFSKYLKMPRRLLINSLQLQLNYPLKKKKKEQNFILSRLRLFDRQFCFHQIFYLYQTYFNLGVENKIWPEEILKIIQSDEHYLIQKYMEEYLILLQNEMEQVKTELMVQSSSCPLTLSPLELYDKRLEEFVRLHHIDLVRTINYQITKLKDYIYEKVLFQQLSSYCHLNIKQWEAIHHLTSIREKQLKIFEDLITFEQRILCHKLPKSFDCIQIQKDDKLCVNKQNKIIQDLKRQMLHVQLEEYEMKIQNYEHLYQQELIAFEIQLSKTNQVDLAIMHFFKQYLNHHTATFIRQIRYKESCLHVKLLRHRRHRSSTPYSLQPITKKTIDVYPQIILDVSKVSLNHIQLDYLSRNGPNYIRPNQSYLHSYHHREKQVKQEHDHIMNSLIPYLVRVHHVPTKSLIIEQFSQKLQTCLYQQYMTPLSYLNIYRIRKELQLVKSIRYRLKKEQYVLRVTDKSGIFHIGHAKEYEQKAEAYRKKTNAYIELPNNPLWTIFDKVVHLLNDLRSKKQILAWQLVKMMPKREKVALAYLYFIPKPHKEGTPLRPIVSSMHTPTTGISKFLDKLIRPLFDKHVRSTTIIDGVDLIRRLENYTAKGYLKPTTLLCTFDITDLYTMLPQEESLNILMWKWEKALVHHQIASNEIYGRYIDDIFFTSNESLDRINQILDEVNNFHPNIKLVRQIGTSLSFLDVFIENKNGILTTSVYHKAAAEPYIVPFQSDHPRHVFKNIIETALLRAIRYSSTLSTFNTERGSIKLMLLYNGYPPRFIYARFKAFLAKYISSSSLASPFIPWIEKENQFLTIRTELLQQQTSIEQQLLFRIATITDKDKNEQMKAIINENKLQIQEKWNKCLILHYRHEQRLANYNTTEELVAKRPSIPIISENNNN